MKRVLVIAALALASVPSFAQWNHHGHHGHHSGSYGHGNDAWVAPLIIGGIAGAIIARESQPVIVQQPPVIVQQSYPVRQFQNNCSAWKEIQTDDGRIYRERTCY